MYELALARAARRGGTHHGRGTGDKAPAGQGATHLCWVLPISVHLYLTELDNAFHGIWHEHLEEDWPSHLEDEEQHIQFASIRPHDSGPSPWFQARALGEWRFAPFSTGVRRVTSCCTRPE